MMGSVTVTKESSRHARLRVRRRARWSDALEASICLAIATGVAFNISSGGLMVEDSSGWVREAARVLGVVAAIFMMVQVALASRAPWIERLMGHDKAISKHARLGKYAILIMGLHITLIVLSTSAVSGYGFVQTFVALGRGSKPLAAATLASALFGIVLLTSLWSGFRRWNYESWHTIHRITYVAVAFAIPHQFIEGSTFRDGGAAWMFWLALYVVSLGSFIAYRMVKPIVLTFRHRARVSAVTRHPDGSVSLEIQARLVAWLGARPGQFFLWRFFTPALVWQKHPYSLSAAPGRHGMRITVKPLGAGSAAVARVRQGTWVSFEGPLGVFGHDARVGNGLVLVAAGIGITPIRAMLEEVRPGEACTVIVRARNRGDAPLIDEVEALASEKGATLFELFGPRGATWGTRDWSGSLAHLVPAVSRADVFICGPEVWAAEVEFDAVASGVPAAAIHRERFGW